MNDNALKLPKDNRPMWSRVLFLPLGNAFPFRLFLYRNTTMAINATIASAELPEPAAETVRRVARQTGLWHHEQIDVAGEMITHFTDGLACGQSANELVASFGDIKPAAKLIRRAKRRNRPLFWRSLSRTIWTAKWAFVATIVFYAALAARFHLGRPNIAWNYMEELNAKAEAIPQDQRAWPLYRAALVALEERPKQPRPSDEDGASEAEPWKHLLQRSPGDANWDEAVQYLNRNQEAIALVREAAARPRFGFVYGDPADLVQCKFEGSPGMLVPEINPADNPMVISFPLAQVQICRDLTRLLLADTRLAAEQGDGQRIVADLTAVMRMSDQHADSPPFLVTDLIRVALLSLALEALGETLADRADVLSDAQLQALAHRIAAVDGGGRIQLRMEGERAFIHDLWQRIYTDDGDGDGRLTNQGAWRLLDCVDSNFRDDNDSEALLVWLGGPVAGLAIANRREMTRMGDRLLDQAEIEGNRPLWEQTESAVNKQIEAMDASPTQRNRYGLVLLLLPAVRAVYMRGEQATQQRDAALVAIALEIYHRRHGEWPERLEQLTPGLLPTVPPDRIDGQPLRYRVTDGQPVVYSIGVDRVDNGGVPSSSPTQAQPGGSWISPEDAASRSPNDPIRGDWILWPTE